jgi:hypothetical protein
MRYFLTVLAGVVLAATAQSALTRRTVTGTASTNATATVIAGVGTLNTDYGTLYRVIMTTSGGTSDVSIVDSDGTVFISTNALVGSYSWTGTERAYKPRCRTSNASATNVAVTITLTIDR